MFPLRTVCLALAALFVSTSSRADDLKKVAAALDGYRFEFPCKDPMPENPKPGADGPSARATDDPATNDKFTDVKKFGGEHDAGEGKTNDAEVKSVHR